MSAVDLFPLGQQFVQLALAADAAQRHLCELGGGKQIILDFAHRQIGIEHAEIKHGVDLHRNVIAGDHVLRRDIHGHRAQIHLDHLFDARNDVNHPRTARTDHATEAKNHAALILFENLDAADDRRHRNDEKCRYRSKSKHVDLLLLALPVRHAAAPPHFERHAVVANDFDLVARLDLVVGTGVPVFAMDKNLSLRLETRPALRRPCRSNLAMPIVGLAFCVRNTK